MSKKRSLNFIFRKMFGFHHHDTSCKIEYIDGNCPPSLIGKRGHWTTKSGITVIYPNAYRRAWGKPIYHKSTRKILIGKEYIINLALAGGFVNVK